MLVFKEMGKMQGKFGEMMLLARDPCSVIHLYSPIVDIEYASWAQGLVLESG